MLLSALPVSSVADGVWCVLRSDALNTRTDGVVRIVMRILQEIASDRSCAVALIPHYRVLLPMFNLLLAKRSTSNAICCMACLWPANPFVAFAEAKTSTLAGVEQVDGHR